MADSVKIKITGDDTDFVKKMDGVGSVAKKGFKVAAAAVAAFSAVAIKQLVDLAEETREYREDMAKLETAFTTAGFTAEQATGVYKEFYAVLGEEDRSVEAVNHLAQLCETEQELNTWTDICTGVWATFGDSLPIEGLTEAANETAKVGQVVGPLADALNWAGISEDAFNESLAACSTEQERQTLITETLNGLYSEAAGKYREVNKSVLDANKANSDYTDTMAAIGEKVEPITTALKIGWTEVLSALLDLVEGVDIEAYAEKIVNAFKSFDPQAAIDGIKKFIGILKTLAPIILTVVTAMAAWKATLAITNLIKGVTTTVKGCQAALQLYAAHGQLANIATQGFTASQKILTTVMGLATGKIKLATVAQKGMTVAQKALNVAMKANPVGLIITAITLLIGIVMLLWNKCDWFREGVLAIFERIKEAFSALWDALKAVWDAIAPYVSAFWEVIKALFSVAINFIIGYFTTAWTIIKAIWDFVQPYFSALWEGIKLVFSVVAEVLGGFFSTAWEAIKFIWDFVVAYFTAVWTGIKLIFSVVSTVLGGFFSAAWEAIKFIWNAVVGFFSGIWNGIKAVFSVVASTFSEWFSSAKNAVTRIWDTVKSYFQGIWSGIKGIFTGEDGIVTRFRNWFKDAYETVKDFFTLKNFKSVFKESIIGGLEDLIDDAKNAAGKIWTSIKEGLSKKIDIAFDMLFGGGGEEGGGGGGAGIGSLAARGNGVNFYTLNGMSGPNVHKGSKAADYPAPRNTPIPALQNGVITSVRILSAKEKDPKGSYGKCIVVRGTDGKSYIYAHMNKFASIARVGQPVARGTIIGYVGATGNTKGKTGLHLHYGLNGYATGGFPSLGEIFTANERGIEMMGKMGDKPVIANNMQIVEGIKKGVFSGMVNLARAKAAANSNTNNISIEQHFHKENTSPSDTKRATRKAVKLALAGDVR